ncbi:MAG: DUF5049 domain-containing protein [Armatimonadota bacterium]
MMEKQPVTIPADVYEGLEAVRQSGVTNMLDRPRVIELAEMMGYEETAEWLRTHRQDYAIGIFQGFRVVVAGETPCAD